MIQVQTIRGSGALQMRSLFRFWTDERGELAPASYLLMVPMAMAFMFFTIDLGIRKGVQLGVEYAAFCAARAAAVNFHATPTSSCDGVAAQAAATRAAAACMAAFVSKKGTPNPTVAGSITPLVDRAQQQLTVTLSGGCSSTGNSTSTAVTATVQYKQLLRVPMSPLSSSTTGTLVTASAQYKVY